MVSLLLTPRRPAVHVELPPNTTVQEYEFTPGTEPPGVDLEQPPTIGLVRIRADELPGPEFLAPVDQQRLHALIRASRVVVVFQPVGQFEPAMTGTAIAGELIPSRSLVTVIECSAAAGMAWLAYAIRTSAISAKVIPVHDLPVGFNAARLAKMN